jgi:TRAP-type C4-dicarboxylate transport system permease small subunit
VTPPPARLTWDHVPRRGLAGRLQAGLDVVNFVMALLSSLAIAAAGCVLTWEVVGRYFLGIPSDWQDELASYLLIGATFASAAWTQARRGHVGIEALAHVLPRKVDRVRRLLADLAAASFAGYFALKCYQRLLEAIDEGQISQSAWGPPLWIPYSVMTLGMALLTVQIVLQIAGGRLERAGE